MKKQSANIITSCRILGSILIIFLPVFSSQFYITYLLCGLSDMVDGTVARKTNGISNFGAKFDTVAEFCRNMHICNLCSNSGRILCEKRT